VDWRITQGASRSRHHVCNEWKQLRGNNMSPTQVKRNAASSVLQSPRVPQHKITRCTPPPPHPRPHGTILAPGPNSVTRPAPRHTEHDMIAATSALTRYLALQRLLGLLWMWTRKGVGSMSRVTVAGNACHMSHGTDRILAPADRRPSQTSSFGAPKRTPHATHHFSLSLRPLTLLCLCPPPRPQHMKDTYKDTYKDT